MRVLVTGSGGREHALAWKIAKSPHCSAVFAAPGNDGMREAQCLPELSAGDADGLVAFARAQRIDLVVIGPEDPLAEGCADRLREAGLLVFGPSAAAARLEAGKAFAREFMARWNIPHPRFEVFRDEASALSHVRARGGPCVVKADGLAAGKGVAVCDTPETAEAAVREIMGARRFGAAGDLLLVEDRLEGEEASYYAITDGEQVVSLAAARDHKRALDGDRGENTGGMGAFAPAASVVDAAVEKRVLEEIVHPTLRGMREEGAPFSGVLYVGLMIDKRGAPSVVEFNVRFGDPETQPLLFAMRGDLLPLLEGAAKGFAGAAPPAPQTDAAVCVVLASQGYPRSYPTGREISGIEQALARPEVMVFHAGVRREGARWLTAGGRVLGVTARGASLAEARAGAYQAASCITFEGMFMRSDIARTADSS